MKFFFAPEKNRLENEIGGPDSLHENNINGETLKFFDFYGREQIKKTSFFIYKLLLLFFFLTF